MEKANCGWLWNNFAWENVFVRPAVQQHALGSAPTWPPSLSAGFPFQGCSGHAPSARISYLH